MREVVDRLGVLIVRADQPEGGAPLDKCDRTPSLDEPELEAERTSPAWDGRQPHYRLPTSR
jgi:hypothetical protein